MAIWILFGVLISIYSTSKVRAMAKTYKTDTFS